MKKNKFLILIFALVLITGCNDNEYVAPGTLSDVSWYTSITPGAANEVAVLKSISFMDISVGALSHQWIIEKDNYFLKPVFSQSDSLPLFIDHTLDTICTAATVHVLFSTVGTAKVRLRNTFKEQVTYKGVKPLKAKLEGNVWVIDTTFVFTVKDNFVVTP